MTSHFKTRHPRKRLKPLNRSKTSLHFRGQIGLVTEKGAWLDGLGNLGSAIILKQFFVWCTRTGHTHTQHTQYTHHSLSHTHTQAIKPLNTRARTQTQMLALTRARTHTLALLTSNPWKKCKCSALGIDKTWSSIRPQLLLVLGRVYDDEKTDEANFHCAFNGFQGHRVLPNQCPDSRTYEHGSSQ